MGAKLTSLLEQFDYISFYWGLLLVLATPLLKTKSVFDLFVLPAWAYAAIAACSQWMYHAFPATVRLSLMYDQMFFMALLAGFVVLLKSEIDSEKIRRVLGVVGVVNLILSVLTVPLDEGFISGLVPNKSMNGLLNIILMPYTCLIVGFWGWFVNIALLFFYHSSTCLFAFGAVIVFAVRPNITQFLSLVVTGSVIASFIPKFFYDGGRFLGYRFFFHRHNFWDFLLGMGPSSFFSIGTWMQKKHHLEGGAVYWVYMHSDPMQLLFEYGTIGLFLMCFVAYQLIKQADDLEKLPVVAILASGVFYYPMHFPVHLVVIALILKIVYDSPVRLESICSHIS